MQTAPTHVSGHRDSRRVLSLVFLAAIILLYGVVVSQQVWLLTLLSALFVGYLVSRPLRARQQYPSE